MGTQPARADDSTWLSPFSITAGGGVAFPPETLGVERWTAQAGLIGRWDILPRLAIEPRGNVMWAQTDIPGRPRLEIVHVEFNATWFPLYEYPLTPLFTAGVGGVRMHHTNALAVNAGAGILVRLHRNIGLRIEARDEAYRVPLSESSEFRHSLEGFCGLTVGFGGWGFRDRDGDGVADQNDRCPATPRGAIVNDWGCPVDGDGDGVPDGIDTCISTPPGVLVDAHGCPKDSDGDGVFDGLDRCPDTAPGALVDPSGCPVDVDMDGVPDGLDRCIGTPRGCTVDSTGCQHDADGDGVCDGVDNCPETQASTRVDAHGCPLPLNAFETELLERGVIRIDDSGFERGFAIITPEGRPRLNEITAVLARWPQLQIQIAASIGSSDGLNARIEVADALSAARARAVLVYMVEQYPALGANRFTTVGLGTAPALPEHGTIEFRLLNPEVMRSETQRLHLVPSR